MMRIWSENPENIEYLWMESTRTWLKPQNQQAKKNMGGFAK
jgi:hypothetical protein